jgi:hypothetical protein
MRKIHLSSDSEPAANSTGSLMIGYVSSERFSSVAFSCHLSSLMEWYVKVEFWLHIPMNNTGRNIGNFLFYTLQRFYIYFYGSTALS